MNYKVMTPCKPRKSPTMYEATTLAEFPVGKVFVSSKSSKVTVIGQVDYGVTFVQDESSLYWLPLFYGGKEYVKLIEVAPPVTGTVVPVEVLVTGSDGSVYKFINPTKV